MTIQDCPEHIQMSIVRWGLGYGYGSRVYRDSPGQSLTMLDNDNPL